MPGKDLNRKPFDAGTIAKLEIFEDYAQAWLPTFIMQKEPVIRQDLIGLIFTIFKNHYPRATLKLT